MAGLVNIDEIELVRRDQVIKAGAKKGLIRWFESQGFSDAIADIEIERTLEGASTLTINAIDPNGVIADLEPFQSQASLYPAEVRVGQYWYAMAGLSKGDDGMLSITFEDREVNTLRRYRSPRKSKRARQTRAQFCASLVHEASIVTDRDGTAGRIQFVSPESSTHQIIGLDGQTVEDALSSDSGFPAGIRLKYLRRTYSIKNAAPGGKPPEIKWKNEIRIANKTQLNYFDKVFKECLKQRAPKQVYQAAALLALSGSNLWNTTDVPGHIGNLFGLPRKRPWLAYMGSGTDAQYTLKKLIPQVVRQLKLRAGAHPKYNGSKLASVTAGRSEATMQPWWPYAQLAVKEWKGGANRTTDAYEFTRGEPNGAAGESTWEAIVRMATEVGWRCWCDAGKVYFVSEAYLNKRPTALTISDSVDGVNGISWSQEGGAIPSEATVSIMAGVFDVDPGAAILVEGEGVANGTWIVQSIRQSVFSNEAELTLTRAQPRLVEPKGEIGALAVSGGSAKVNTAPAAIAAMVKKANEIDGHAYSQDNRTGPSYDCSSAVSALLQAGGFIPKGVWMTTIYGGPHGGGTNRIGVSGRGKYFTVHSSGGGGNDGHTWIVFEKASGVKGAPKMFEFGGRRGGRNGWKNYVRRDRPARHIKGF